MRIVALALAWVVGCSGTTGSPLTVPGDAGVDGHVLGALACTPGASVGCVCTSGSAGAQICGGGGLGPCECSDARSGDAGGGDSSGSEGVGWGCLEMSGPPAKCYCTPYANPDASNPTCPSEVPDAGPGRCCVSDMSVENRACFCFYGAGSTEQCQLAISGSSMRALADDCPP